VHSPQALHFFVRQKPSRLHEAVRWVISEYLHMATGGGVQCVGTAVSLEGTHLAGRAHVLCDRPCRPTTRLRPQPSDDLQSLACSDTLWSGAAWQQCGSSAPRLPSQARHRPPHLGTGERLTKETLLCTWAHHGIGPFQQAAAVAGLRADRHRVTCVAPTNQTTRYRWVLQEDVYTEHTRCESRSLNPSRIGRGFSLAAVPHARRSGCI
jgi:hypothetical protein